MAAPAPLSCGQILFIQDDPDGNTRYFSDKIVIVLACPLGPTDDWSLIRVELLGGKGANYWGEFADLQDNGQSDEVISSIHDAILMQDPTAQLPSLDCSELLTPDNDIPSVEGDDEAHATEEDGAPSTPMIGKLPVWH